jgi:DNA repair protein RadA
LSFSPVLYDHNYYNRNNKKVQRISTGSNNLDELLLGGIETYAITEFYGPTGTGKTQLCHTLSVLAQQQQDKGQSKDRLNAKVLYIDTDNTFRPERIVSIAQSRGFDVGTSLRNILYVRAYASYHQELIIKQVGSFIEKHNTISLLIIDSVITNYRAEFLGPSKLSERQKKLYQFMNRLHRIAQTYGIAVVLTNQVNSYTSHVTAHTGGNIMVHTSTYRICLRRPSYNSRRIIATIVSSTYHPENEACFTISEKGIENIEDIV